MYTCSQCKLKFNTVNILLTHLRSLCFASKDVTNFNCGEEGCFRHFSCLGSLRKHLNKFHCVRDPNIDLYDGHELISALPSTSQQQSSLQSTENPVSIHNHQTDLDHQTALFVSSLYGNPLIPRSNVQVVMDSMQFFLVDSIKNLLRSGLTPTNSNLSQEHDQLLLKFKNLLKGFDTEHKRLQYLGNVGTYIAHNLKRLFL